VVHHHLNGLSPPDALAFMRDAGVKGDEKAMLEFAALFGRHSLLLKVVCGMIADYKRKPHDFDAWRADPIYGGSLKLSEIDLKQNYTHILHFSLRGLNDNTRTLLCRIAVISENATYDTLAVLNPFLPPKPEEVGEPGDPSDDWNWDESTKSEKQKRRRDNKKAQEAYTTYLDAVRLYPTTKEYRKAVTSFDAALKELEERGMLYWDRDVNRYEMHPLIRAYAAELLDANDRTETFHKARNHFESLPPDDFDKATELAHLSHSLDIYRCFVGAGMLDEAARFYRGELACTLLFNVGAYPVVLELLKPIFHNDLEGMPCLTSASDRIFILAQLAHAYYYMGRLDEALRVYGKTLQLTLKEKHWKHVVAALSSLRASLRYLNRKAEAAAALALARELADAAVDFDGGTRTILDQMGDAIDVGRFAEADVFETEFRQRPNPPKGRYLPGDMEYWRCESLFHQMMLTVAEWQAGHNLAVRHRNVYTQYRFLRLRAEWELAQDRPEQALESIDQALQITNRLGTPKPDYHDVRAWALAKLNRQDEARAELEDGEHELYAAEAHLILNDHEQARTCSLNAYTWAWGEGPPHIHWYVLERCKALLKLLGEPEPQLPPFDPAKVPPIPFETEIRAAIAKLNAEKDAKKS